MRLPVWYVRIAGFDPELGAYFACATTSEAKTMAWRSASDAYPDVRYTDTRPVRCYAGTEVATVDVFHARHLLTHEVLQPHGPTRDLYFAIDPAAEREAVRRWGGDAHA